MYNFDDYEKSCKKLIKAKAFFIFKIECYHNIAYWDKQGVLKTRKEVTNMASQVVNCFNSVD